MSDPKRRSGPKRRSFYQAWGWAIVVLTVAAVPFIFNLAGQAVLDSNNRVEDWLPKSFDSTRELAWFRKHFASEQFIIVSWEGCRLGDSPDQDDPRIAELAQALVPTAPPKESSGELDSSGESRESTSDSAQSTSDLCRRYFKSVLTGRMVLDQLTGPPLNLELDQAVGRVRGSLIGDDGKQTCVLVTLTMDATRELSSVLGRGQPRLLRPDVPPGVLWQQLEQIGIDSASVHVGGPPVDNAAIDEEGKRTLVRLAGLSGLLGIGLAWWALRSTVLTGLVFFCGVVSAATSLAIVRVTGGSVDAILMSMPSLVYVLTISGAVHLISYYREAIEQQGMLRASERAVALAWKPAVLCSITTAVGLLSLLSSELVPIRRFGTYSATGVIALVGILYFFLPAALQITQIGRRWLSVPQSGSAAKVNRGLKLWTAVGSVIVKHYRLVGAFCLLITALVGYGLRYSTSSINLLKLFDSHARILQDYQWLEDNVGNLVPMELVVCFPIEQDQTIRELSLLQRFEFVLRLQHLLAKDLGERGEELIGNSMSAATFLPAIPVAVGNSNYLQRKAIESRLEKTRHELERTGFYCSKSTDGRELWRISVRVAAFEDVDYGSFVHRLRETATPLLEAYLLRERVLESLDDELQNATGRKKVLVFRDTIVDKATPTQNVEAVAAAGKRSLWSNYLASLLREYRCDVEFCDTPLETAPLDLLERLKSYDAVVVGESATADLQLASGFATRFISLEDKPTTAPPTSVDIVYTGVVPIVYQAQRALLNSLVSSTWWSFLTITPIMMFVSRSMVAGIVAMLPNLMPILLIFGGMGWLGVPIDIGSMMTASIALGVAVDDTIHFLARYREELHVIGDRQQAIIKTYGQCAVPTLQAALISGLGLSVFAFSTFTPTQRFGWLMLCILLAGVVSELLLLPAILNSRLGNVFMRGLPATPPPEPNRILGENGIVHRVDPQQCLSSSHHSLAEQRKREQKHA